MSEGRGPSWHQLDWILLAAATALALIGIAFIESARGGEAGFAREALRQAIYLGVALTAFGVCAVLDYRKLARWAPWLWAAGLGLLIAVIFVGSEAGGARSWIRLGGISVQPSELMKVAVVLLVAAMFGKREAGRLRFRDVLAYGFVVGLPVAIIGLQNDAGTALTFLPLLFGVVFVSGLRWRWLAVAGLALALLAPLGWSQLKDYQKKRILIVFNEDFEPQGAGWQSSQSRIAVGGGGLFGQGYRQGPQNRLGFLPERHTDYIFAIVAEEWGFAGAIMVLGLYVLVLQRMVHALSLARDRLGAMLCLGALSFFAVHLVVNVGMVIGLLPTIGIPLPLLSFGGSALLATFCLLGLVAGVGRRRFST